MKRNMFLSIFTIVLSLLMTFSINLIEVKAVEGIKMNTVFSNNMVLQRNKKVEIYGIVSPNKEVKVSFGDQIKVGTSDEDGNFSIYLDEMEASSTGRALKVECEGAIKIFDNVLVGEVYYGSGQSNMAYPIDEFLYAESIIESDSSWGDDHEKYKNRESFTVKFNEYKNYNLVRFYTQHMLPITNGVNNKGETNKWIAPKSFNDLNYVSLTAVAYAINLSQKLGDIPVGIMVAGVGGSQIHEWIDDKGAEQIFPGNSNSTLSQRYNNMVVPMGRFTIRGILWYQGESDVYGSLETYETCFKYWANQMRDFYKDENLPIITFQLPQFSDIYCEGLWGDFRILQEKIANESENVFYVCGIDLGDHKNIHPVDKYEFCERAVGLALKYIYNIEYSGKGSYGKSPVVDKIYRKAGSNISYITFNDAELITISTGNRIGLEATTNYQAYSDINNFEKVGKNTISFTSKLKYVSYLQNNTYPYDTAFMYNEYGLPVSPFANVAITPYDYDVKVNLEGATVLGDDIYFVNEGDSVTFKLEGLDGYTFKSLKINGEDVPFGTGEITLENIDKDYIIDCVFETMQSEEPDNPGQDAPTDNPGQNEPTPAPSTNGCGGSIVSSICGILTLAGFAFVARKRKEEQ